MKKYFTPQQANKTLPLVRTIVSEIIEKGNKIREIINTVSGDQIPPEALQLNSQIEGLMIELEELGCYYKDWNFEMGMVDFPSIIDGNEVFLCWKSDEDLIGWYHDLYAGFAGRKPIPEKLLV